ncbi:MAG TPA: hypothetical protein VM689_15080 [Aliidongia sp.]|nr:hypothetical protein [Aliidongia sp.]
MSDPTNRTLAEIETELEESEAQIAVGQSVPLEPVLERLRASIRRMETRQAEQMARTRKA